MFVGHAETLHDMDLPLTPVAPALYRRIDAGDLKRSLPEIYVQPGESHLVTRARDSAHGARLLRRHRVLDPAAGRRRALPSDAAATARRTRRQDRRRRRPPLCGLRHSRPGPAVRSLWARCAQKSGEALRRRRCAAWSPRRDRRPTVGRLNCEAALRVLRRRRLHRGRIEPGRDPRPSTFNSIPGPAKCCCGGSIRTRCRKLEQAFAQVDRSGQPPIETAMANCTENSRSDRGRLRRGSPDAERRALLRPGDRSHRHGRRSLCRGRAHRRTSARCDHARYRDAAHGWAHLSARRS